MASGLSPDVRVYPDPETLSRAAARDLAERITTIVAGEGRFTLALAGGNTPRPLYRLLAAEHRDQIPWARVHLFWGDERYVPQDDPRSNYRLAREALLDHVPIPAENVHPMSTDFPDPDAAARAYEDMLRSRFASPWPHFDTVLLGLGTDGHTASLFPGSPALEEQERWVVAVRAPVEPSLRLTLTLPVLNHAAQVSFLVAGEDKARALHRAFADAPHPRICPAAGVRPRSGDVIWWVDDAAAALLDTSVRLRAPGA